MDRTHTTRRIGIVGLLLAAAALALLLAPQQRHITELEATSPEVTAAQHAFIASEKSAQAAEKELEEVENDVPGWMSQLPPSMLKDTVRQLTRRIQPQSEAPKPVTTAGPAAPVAHPSTASRAQSASLPAKSLPAKHTSKSSVPGLNTEMKHDSKLQDLDSELTQIMAKARALKSAAKLAKAKAVAKKISGSKQEQDAAAGRTIHRKESKGSGLNAVEKKELGELFGLNTVLKSITRARQETLKLEHPNDPNYKPPPPPLSPAQRKREEAAAAKAHAAKLKRLKDEDMARAEGKAALAQAARVLLRQLHGNRDKWLRKTLHNIASNAASVEADKQGIRELRHAVGSSHGGRQTQLSGVAKAALQAAARTKTQRRVSSTEAATEEREKGEANRLLDHMLRMAHTDFKHVKREAPKLQAEAKDGEIMHKAGREAVQHALAREDEGRRQEDKARKMDEKVRCEIKHKTAQSQYNSYQVCVFWSLISGCRRSETQAA